MGMMFTNSLAYDMNGRKRKAKKVTGEVYKKYKPEFKTYVPPVRTPRRDEGVIYKSVPTTSNAAQTPRKESMKYTGTLIRGIATMHKSNAVPVIEKSHAEDISKMRR